MHGIGSMKPNNSHHSASSSSTQDSRADASRDSAAELIRQQLHNLYSQDGQTDPMPATAHQKAQQAQAVDSGKIAASVDATQWKQYHSAWQEYYQKYYQQYYTGYAHKVIQQHTERIAKQPASSTQNTASSAPSSSHTDAHPHQQSASQPHPEDVNSLRAKLREKVRASAKKARGSRHFVPVAAAMAVVMVFAFLQYNQLLMGNVQAYISPGAVDSQNIIVDPSTDVAVGPEPKLIIPKINVDVPVVYGVGADEKSQMAAMQHGVAHWPGGDQAKSVPGQAGNTVIAGHSSNDLFEASEYKFVFAQVEKLEKGDKIFAHYQGKRYTYLVTRKDIIKPVGEWQNIITQTDKPMLVLVTCWPLGTAQKRLLVTAEQISPDPATVAPAPAPEGEVTTTESMTGTSPTALEWFLGLFR